MNTAYLKQILSIQSVTGKQFRMFAFIVRELKKIDCNFYVDEGCIYITKGHADNYPCVVAHMDTVHRIVEDLIVLECGNNLTGFNRVRMQQTGIGGDDKVGIFIALECLKLFDNIKVCFFRDEESGCNGSYGADKKFFQDCGYVLQCDRNGNEDFVTNASGIPLSSASFQYAVEPLMKKYGYKFEYGLMTDVMALKEIGIGCSAANISCGYYRPHSNDEYVNVIDVDRCLDLVKDIIIDLGETMYKHVYKFKPKKKSKSRWPLHPYKDDGRLSRSSFFDDGDLPHQKDTPPKSDFCECCCETSKNTTYVYEYSIDMCQKCIDNYIENYKTK